MRIYTGFESHLDECPACGHDFQGRNLIECPECDYHTGGDRAVQWIEWVETTCAAAPFSVDFAHEGEPDDYYLDVTLSDNTSIADLTAWLTSYAVSVDLDPGDLRALKKNSAFPDVDEATMLALADILDAEDGGREHGIAPSDLVPMIEERVAAWLRDQRAEGLR